MSALGWSRVVVTSKKFRELGSTNLLACRSMLGIRLGRGVCAAGLVLVALSACSDDRDSDRSPGEDSSASTSIATTTTSTTQPPAADLEGMVPHIEELLGQWDEAMVDVLADLEAVEADPAHPARIALADSFTSDSPYVEDLGLLLSGYIDQDVSSITGAVQDTTLSHFTESSADDPDFVSFVFCSYSDAELTVGGEDEPAEVVITDGAGEAHRVDGIWRLHRLQQLGRETDSAGAPNPCPDLVDLEGEE